MELKNRTCALLAGLLALAGCADNTDRTTNDTMETLQLTREWDKTFPQS